MSIYSIRVTLPDHDFPLMTAYDIEAPNRDDAQILAREKFAGIYGCEYSKLKTYVMYNETRQAEDLAYYRQSGLPDEIPS
jgi:hypothetical protein